MVLGEKEIH